MRSGNNVFDVSVMIFFGIVGYFMRKLGFEPAPLVLAFVLGPMLENNLRKALILSQGDLVTFLQRPISAACLVHRGVDAAQSAAADHRARSARWWRWIRKPEPLRKAAAEAGAGRRPLLDAGLSPPCPDCRHPIRDARINAAGVAGRSCYVPRSETGALDPLSGEFFARRRRCSTSICFGCS